MSMIRKQGIRGRTGLHSPGQRYTPLAAAILAACLCVSPVPALGDFIVSQWGLGVEVDSEPGPSDGRGFYAVQNPFVSSHSASIPTAQAAAQYDISWLLDYGSFNISAQLAAQDGSSVRSLASGTVYMQSDIDLLLSVDALLNYNLPAYGVDAYLSFAVRDLSASQYILSEYRWYSTFSQPPGSGALSMTPSVILPAEHEFRIQYQMLVQTSGYSQNLASAAGYTNWTLAPTPEPATLALLAPFAFLPWGRARRGRRRCTQRRVPLAYGD